MANLSEDRYRELLEQATIPIRSLCSIIDYVSLH